MKIYYRIVATRLLTALPERELLQPVCHFGTGLIHLVLAEYTTVVVAVAKKNTLIYVNYIESILKIVK